MIETATPHRPNWHAVVALSVLLTACGGTGSEAESTTEQATAASVQEERLTAEETASAQQAGSPADASTRQEEEPTANATAAEQQAELAVDATGTGQQELSTAGEDERAVRQAVVQHAVTKNVTGFAAKANVTGGAGGDVITVSNARDLEKELCRKSWGDVCIDHDKRVIQVKGVIDMTQKPAEADGCYATKSQCAFPQKPEVTLTINEWERGHCVNKEGRGKYSYSPAGVKGLLVGSNKTVIGLQDARLKGRGLLLQGKVSNIIIRNLSFTDINSGRVFGGDAIKIFDADGVLIDHNYFARIGRQMISTTGDGSNLATSTDVTISNNEFDGRNEYSWDCSGKSYWGLLIGGSDRVTLVGNWMHDFGGRWPKLVADNHVSVVHMVNNLFENSGHSALQYSGKGQRVLAEGNYFSNVADPVARIDHHGAQLFGLYSQTAALQQVCTNAIGRICSGNVATPKDNDATMVQDTYAISAFKDHARHLVKAYPATRVPETVRANAGVGKVHH